jgi:acyl-coenzyme A thioesterase PaaI-like protein
LATTNLNINLLCMPAGDRDILGDCRLLKVGRKLIVGEVSLSSEGDERAVAHVVGTYARLRPTVFTLFWTCPLAPTA